MSSSSSLPSGRSLRPRAANNLVLVSALAAAAATAVAPPASRGPPHYVLRGNRIVLCPVCLRQGYAYEKEIAKHLAYHRKANPADVLPYTYLTTGGRRKYDYTTMRNVTAEQAGHFLQPERIEALRDTVDKGDSYALMPVGFANTSQSASDMEVQAMITRWNGMYGARLGAAAGVGVVPAAGGAASGVVGVAGPVPIPAGLAPPPGAAATTAAAAATAGPATTTTEDDEDEDLAEAENEDEDEDEDMDYEDEEEDEDDPAAALSAANVLSSMSSSDAGDV